ncbi:unnamed protein product [Angiostrongylus costaricensis]|uniref:Receptor-type adenylate cyclase n=1 Tax=Angiostrongylus costaricensis TaxID=334426 RepID=A0A158PLC0_ANGCS|nr:unnamed protein product [Angiostrongylus costaricensis]
MFVRLPQGFTHLGKETKLFKIIVFGSLQKQPESSVIISLAGTDSGMCTLAAKIYKEIPDRIRNTFSVLPSPQVSEAVGSGRADAYYTKQNFIALGAPVSSQCYERFCHRALFHWCIAEDIDELEFPNAEPTMDDLVSDSHQYQFQVILAVQVPDFVVKNGMADEKRYRLKEARTNASSNVRKTRCSLTQTIDF